MAVRDVLFIGVAVFILGIAFFVLNFTANTMIDSLIAIPTINESQNTVDTLNNIDNNVTSRLDYVLLGTFIALTLGIIITGWFIGGMAIFMVIYIIIVILAVIFSSVLAYTWQEVSVASVFGLTINAFPITNHIISWLPLYTAGIGFIGIIVMFAKPYFTGDEY